MPHRLAGTITVALLASVLVAPGPARPAAGPPAPIPAAPGEHTVLDGAWRGSWASAEDSRRGSAEVVLSRGQEPRVMIGQFTFLVSGKARTARREGLVIDDRVRFELVGGGEIVLRRDGDRLVGEFLDVRGGLPVPRGHLELERVG